MRRVEEKVTTKLQVSPFTYVPLFPHVVAVRPLPGFYARPLSRLLPGTLLELFLLVAALNILLLEYRHLLQRQSHNQRRIRCHVLDLEHGVEKRLGRRLDALGQLNELGDVPIGAPFGSAAPIRQYVEDPRGTRPAPRGWGKDALCQFSEGSCRDWGGQRRNGLYHEREEDDDYK